MPVFVCVCDGGRGCLCVCAQVCNLWMSGSISTASVSLPLCGASTGHTNLFKFSPSSIFFFHMSCEYQLTLISYPYVATKVISL